MSEQSPESFTRAAVALIQSESLRAWATSARNLPIVHQLAAKMLAKDPALDPQTLATYLTVIAMG